MKTEKYPYAVTTTASEDYPMEVHIGYFLDEKEELICGVPRTGYLSAGWQGDAAEGEGNHAAQAVCQSGAQPRAVCLFEIVVDKRGKGGFGRAR